MKEAFKIGGYAWHAHKRFEAIKSGWPFNKTAEWLETIGIRFGRDSIRNFANVYVTYQTSLVLTASLTEFYKLVNEQAAKVFAVTERTIQRWKPEAIKQKRLSQEEVQKIQELKEQGKTQREIAEEIGVNQNAVQHHLNKKENFPICSDPDSPSPTEPPNVIKAPVEFKRREPIQREVHIDLDDDEDEEDLDIEAPDDEKKVYRVVKKEPSLSGDHYIRYIPLQLGRI